MGDGAGPRAAEAVTRARIWQVRAEMPVGAGYALDAAGLKADVRCLIRAVQKQKLDATSCPKREQKCQRGEERKNLNYKL